MSVSDAARLAAYDLNLESCDPSASAINPQPSEFTAVTGEEKDKRLLKDD